MGEVHSNPSVLVEEGIGCRCFHTVHRGSLCCHLDTGGGSAVFLLMCSRHGDDGAVFPIVVF